MTGASDAFFCWRMSDILLVIRRALSLAGRPLLSESGLGFTTDLVLLTHLNLDGELLACNFRGICHALLQLQSRFSLAFLKVPRRPAYAWKGPLKRPKRGCVPLSCA